MGDETQCLAIWVKSDATHAIDTAWPVPDDNCLDPLMGRNLG